MKSSIMFLLGSGVSLPAGFPGTGEITSQVFSGNKIIRHTDSRYYLKENPTDYEKQLTDGYLTNVLSLLQTIRELMGTYNKQEPLNYEILFYFIQQLYAYESGDLLNMALTPFLNQVKANVQLTQNELYNEPVRYIDVFSEAENYIRHTVWRKLVHAVDRHNHLTFLSDAINDKGDFTINISTLNHDLLIEQHLTDKRINYCDGFGSPTNGVRYWENHFEDRNNLLKIHGSINWFTLKPDDGDWFDERIGIVLDGDIDHAKSSSGGLMRSIPEKEPKILVGTFNKIYEYTESIFSDIYYHFRELLGKSKSLVVSGYSFGDKGVNTAILEWLYTDRQHRIIVIHRDPDELLRHTAKMAIRKAYTGVAKNNFVTIPKYIQDTSWKEIKEKLVSNAMEG